VCLVKVIMAVMFVLAYPLSLCLDFMLGQDLGQIYSTSELLEMVKLQVAAGATSSEVGRMAKQVVQGALDFRNKTVAETMTPIADAFMLSDKKALSYDTIREIFESGFSRIPVYGTDCNDYTGLLYTKDLILADPEDEMGLRDFISIFDRQALSFKEDLTLPCALNLFKQGQAHLALVRRMCLDDVKSPRCETVGVITLEDIVEEILQDEIVDEDDVYKNVSRRDKVDGREQRRFNIGVFNPVWVNNHAAATLSYDEIVAIAAHLHLNVFGPSGGLSLSYDAVVWLVRAAEVLTHVRAGLEDCSEPDVRDRLYEPGLSTTRCTLVLQGRLSISFGMDGFRTEAGAFKVLARDALKTPGYVADFAAHVSTQRARLLFISLHDFQMAGSLSAQELARGDSSSRTTPLERSPSLVQRTAQPQAFRTSPRTRVMAASLPSMVLEEHEC